MKLQILKCHGSGNDFILIDEYEEILFSEKERVSLSKAFCNRKGILGADGILFFQNTANADGKMRMFNPDGSEAEMCGNGLRCIGRFACERLEKTSVFIETQKGCSRVTKDKDIHKSVKTYKAELNDISLNTRNIPIIVNSESLINQSVPALSEHLKFTAVSMPNPHIVSIVDNISSEELNEVGKKSNQLKDLFLDGVNVNFCQIIGEASIFVKTYERGVGLTNSCGSGMSASSLVSCLLGHNVFNKPIDVYNQGGLVRCEPTLNDYHQHSVFLSGNATFVFSKTIEFEFSNLSEITQEFGKIFMDEIQNYGKLMTYSEYKLEQFVTE
ncbi:diaminopimelate epimerase [Candidatus Parabeggiatoa sp. HSG14]|uniref:diaminopimelate epimerase n=1 Tax=Candidatus Parabeggiatoa sp. HSG14 TaxID=3055593 RepID=UPI0025A8F1E8|nr:diaminopimelate epimerase [Thiotrichales bacterium HSG14]